ncbi:MAG: HipA domain-containing protein [Myxococcota bacterium]
MASDDPAGDRRLFLQAQIVYWLLGATDGHAKNFSIHLLPAGRFRLTPLYDVMSAQPYVNRHQIRRNKMKLAMAVDGKYRVGDIRLRHFERVAREGGLAEATFAEMVTETAARVPSALEETFDALPSDFPPAMADAIADGIRKRLVLLAGG